MDYFTLQNKIKKDFDKSWMTPSQLTVFEKVEGLYHSQNIINIYGNSGVGKTFLAWNIEKELNGSYIKNIDDIESRYLIILDDYPSNRKNIRLLIQESFMNDIDTVIFFSNKKADDDILKIELVLSEEDKASFKHNLWKHLNFKFDNEEESYNLNSLIKYNIC